MVFENEVGESDCKDGRATTREHPKSPAQIPSRKCTACLIGTLNLPSGDGLATRAEQIIWFCFNTPTLAPNNAPVPAKAAK